MGGLFSRNSVAPQQELSVVAATTYQASKAKKNKRHKFNTLVPDPQGPNFTPQGTAGSASTARTSTATEMVSRADLRVQFLKAVKRGDVAAMTLLLQQYQQARPQSPGSHEEEGEEGNEDLVNIRGMWESTPLISAAQYAHCDAALWLLSHSANPHASNEKEVTALLLASLEGLVPVVERLLEVVRTASKSPHIDSQVGVVYNSAADVNVRLSPLLAACMNGHVEIARLLLDHGSDVNQKVSIAGSPGTSGSSTALLLAARYGHASAVTLLLQRGADYCVLDGATDASALVAACENGHEECALQILQAMLSDHTEVRVSIDTETEIWQATNRQGFSPLHFAAANGLLSVCEALLAALKAQQQTLEDEVMAMAFVNARAGARKENALLLAVRKRQYDVARLLLEAGADAELADRGGNTATQVLTRNKQDGLLQLCQTAAMSKSLRQLSRSSPAIEDILMAAANSKKEEEVRRAETHARADDGVDDESG